MKTSLTAWYARIIGGFLLVQGLATGTLLLVDPLDKAFPGILDTTEMVLQHSALHVLTGLLALAILRWGGERDLWRFALGFGLFYTALGAGGLVTGHSPGLGLQPFDHSFHLVVGLPGLLAAWFARPGRRRELTTTAPGPLPPRST